jgi:hypothetical protein
MILRKIVANFQNKWEAPILVLRTTLYKKVANCKTSSFRESNFPHIVALEKVFTTESVTGRKHNKRIIYKSQMCPGHYE